MKKLSEAYSQKILSFNKLIPPQRAHIFIATLLLFIALLAFPRLVVGNDILRIHVLDVGYADAILIELPDSQQIMIDAGEDTTTPDVVDYLNTLNIQSIHTAIITHPHLNHFEGFFGLLKSFSIGKLLINGDKNSERGYEELLEQFSVQNIPVKTLKRGEWIDDLPDNVRMEILHPQKLDGSPNDNSLVIKLIHNDVVFLLTGDIGIDTQDQLIELYEDIGRADIVKVPHHGGPLSDHFIDTFADKIVVISTGPNQWDLPRDYDLERLNATVYRTDVHGTIIFESNGLSVKVNTTK